MEAHDKDEKTKRDAEQNTHSVRRGEIPCKKAKNMKSNKAHPRVFFPSPDTKASRRYLYEGWNLAAEYDFLSSGAPPSGLTLVCTYHWGLDIAGSLAQTAGVGALLMIRDHTDDAETGTRSYFAAFDGNGNVTGLVGESGATAAVYEYTPYGELMRCEGAYAKKNPFRFSTKHWDEESGLVHYGFRYYSPTNGKFINKDPIGENGGINLYGFVQNNPINLVDVLGMDWELQCVDVWDDSIDDYRQDCEMVYVMDVFKVVGVKEPDIYFSFDDLTIGLDPIDIDIDFDIIIDSSNFEKMSKCLTQQYVSNAPAYEPDKWNDYNGYDDGIGVKANSNCYAYATNQFGPFTVIDYEAAPDSAGDFPTKVGFGIQPGGDILNWTPSDRSVRSRAISDGLLEKHAEWSYPVYYFTGKDKNGKYDYHWYRPNGDGTLSHKRGATEVTDKDASDKVITDPKKADKDYSKKNSINYNSKGGKLWVKAPIPSECIDYL